MRGPETRYVGRAALRTAGSGLRYWVPYVPLSRLKL